MTSTPASTQHATFHALLARLNRAQKAAVGQIEGPVLVIAGPGTGKTHILAARIGKILLDTDTLPQNVLCLTFTDAGAHAMRERLLTFLGPEAHRVPVHTFHGFCNRIIQENLEYFGGRRDLEPATDLERIEIARELLAKLPPEHPLRREQKNPFTFEKHLLDLFSMMKREDWTPGHVRRNVRAYLESLPERAEFIFQKTGKNFKKGDLKTAEIEEEKKKMERLEAAADLFPKFNAAMERAGRYDYEDMILWVIRAFERHETLLRACQERYLYVLVDEYQDTNGAQNRLLHRLLDFWESPNVFIVGDDDQSIYEFQGARLKNLVDFYNKFKTNLLLVVLEENYRSTQAILDPAGLLIARNELRAIRSFDVALEKKLTAARSTSVFDSALPWPTEAKPGESPKILAFDNPLAEAAALVEAIERLREAGEPLSEVAVLYAKHRQSERLMTLLEKKGIPFETKRPVNVLDLPLIRQFRTLLEYLRDERREAFSGEHRIFEMLHFRFFGVQPVDVARVAAAAAAVSQPSRWREILGNDDFLKTCQVSDFQPFKNIFQKIETWLDDVAELPLPIFLEKIANQSDLLQHILNLPDRLFFLQALNTLLDFSKKESARNPRFSLEKLLDQLATLDANGLALPMQQHIRTGDGVQLLTAHGAKGLEFRHVFLIGCTEDFWERRRGNTGGRFTLPDTLTFSTTEDETEALRRLFYVACTRAKDHLTISFSRKNADGKDSMPSRFVAETGLPTTETEVAAERLGEAQTLLLLDAPKPTVTLPEDARVDEILKNFALSPTSFNRFLRCPLAFYYQDVLRVPELSSENASFGHAMHTALQQLFLTMKRTREFPSETALAEFFEKEMEEKRAFFGHESYRQYLALGKNYLPRYHRQERSGWRKNSEVERRVALVEVAGVPLTGVIDRFEKLDGGQIRVIDYKTGQQKKEKTAPPDEKQPYGGDYWRQLIFYKILLEAAQPSPGTVVSGAISYLEPDKKTGIFPNVELVLSAENEAFVKNLLLETDAKIRRREFTEGCGEVDCVWCRMHRENALPELFDNMEEDLDDAA